MGDIKEPMQPTSRRHRHQRQDPPPPMRLTERDQEVIAAVYHHRILSQGQIERLLFAGTHRSVAQRRLALLYDHGYLDRRFLPRIGGLVTSPILYLLDKKGSEYLLAHRGYDDIHWRPGDNSLGYEHIEHLLAINTFRIEMTLACRTHNLPLQTWLDDTTLKQDYDRVNLPRSAHPVAVIPDAYFSIATPKGDTHFFLELDRGTMTSKRFKGKVLAYIAYASSGLAEKRFGTTKFRVLTVTESEKRAENLKNATEGVGGKRRFWFGTLADLRVERILTEPVWLVAGREDRAVLLQ